MYLIKNMKKIKFIILVFFTISCSKSQEKGSLLDIETEKWKKELLFNGEVGPPCSEDYVKWGEDNPDVYYGLPKKIDHKTSDFNNDGKDDFLLYFHAGDPCNGGNGNGSDFSKLIYSEGENYLYNNNLTHKIEQLIKQEFQNKTNSYSNINTIIFISDFDKEISGDYILWTENDAHCCPSYSGKYKYNLLTRTIEMSISKNIK